LHSFSESICRLPDSGQASPDLIWCKAETGNLPGDSRAIEGSEFPDSERTALNLPSEYPPDRYDPMFRFWLVEFASLVKCVESRIEGVEVAS